MSCGPDRELLRLMLGDLLRQAIEKGEVQGGLLNCAGGNLPEKTKMQSCAEAAADKAEVKADVLAAKTEAAQAVSDEVAERKAAVVVLEKAIAALTDTKPTQLELTAERKVKLVLSDGTAIETGVVSDTTLTRGEVVDTELVLTSSDGSAVRVDLCGWKPPKPCEYHATLQINFGGDACGMFKRVGWGFHADDLRDPAADTRLTDCDDNTIGWIYPTSADNHTIDVLDAKGTLLGYALSSPVARVWGAGCNDCDK